MTRRSTNHKRAARALAKRENISYQQALTRILESGQTSTSRATAQTGRLVDEITQVLRQHLADAAHISSVEITYDEDKIAGIHIYRSGMWTTELTVGDPGYTEIAEIVSAHPDEHFAITNEGPVGAFGAMRQQYVVRLTDAAPRNPFAQDVYVCDYCEEDVRSGTVDGAPAWVTTDGEAECWESPDSAHNVFNPLAGLDNGPCLSYVIDEGNLGVCARCLHPSDEHDLSGLLTCPSCGSDAARMWTDDPSQKKPYECGECGHLFTAPAEYRIPVGGVCQSCGHDRPHPLTVDGTSFLPGSICPSCGAREGAFEVEMNDGWLVELDGEGTIRWIDEFGNTECVFTLADEEWDQYVGPLPLDVSKADVAAAVESKG